MILITLKHDIKAEKILLNHFLIPEKMFKSLELNVNKTMERAFKSI